MKPTYKVSRTAPISQLTTDWNSPLWTKVPALPIDQYRPESSSFHPKTEAKLQYDGEYIYGIFRVEDQYMICTHTEYNSGVSEDSCVEIFIRPEGSQGYINFEMNCGGTMLVFHILKHKKISGGGFEEYYKIPIEDAEKIKIKTTMPKEIREELTEPTTWTLAFAIPFALFQKHIKGLEAPTSQSRWTANLYKCVGNCSHPHWGAWAAVSEYNYHLPHDFGTLTFA